MNNRYIQFKNLDKIKRFRGVSNTRFNKIRLDANERVSDFDKNFINKIKSKIKSEHLSIYPEVEGLYTTLARKLRLKKENFLITAGADTGIRHCFELLSRPKSQIITIDPTFGMVDIYAKVFNSKQIKIGYDSKLNLNLDKMYSSITKKVSMILFANPNSPTGTVIDHKNVIKILKLAKRVGCYVVVDEAYFGFYSKSLTNLINKYKNLIVLRTFSKAYGLAGCRAGFIVSNKKTIKRLYVFRPMYEISAITLLIVNEILKSDKIVKKYIRETNLGKKYLMREITKLKLSFYKTYSNFILINFKTLKNQKLVINYLKNKNILSRQPPNIKACKNYVRFTIGPVKYMKSLVKMLKKL